MNTLRTLHILNKAPDHARSAQCLAAIGPDDGLLLIENAVLALPYSAAITVERLYALTPDIEARGLTGHGQAAQSISFDDMVTLTATAQNVISW